MAGFDIQDFQSKYSIQNVRISGNYRAFSHGDIKINNTIQSDIEESVFLGAPAKLTIEILGDLVDTSNEGSISTIQLGYCIFKLLKGNMPIDSNNTLLFRDGLMDYEEESDEEEMRDLWVSNMVSMSEFLKTLGQKSYIQQYSDIDIAVLERIYIEGEYRCNGLADYIISNLEHIIKLYSNTFIRAIVLEVGDFRREYIKTKEITDSYIDWLKDYYSKYGFVQLTSDIKNVDIDLLEQGDYDNCVSPWTEISINNLSDYMIKTL